MAKLKLSGLVSSIIHVLLIHGLVYCSFSEDVLTPYKVHGSKRYTRDIKNCQHVSWENETFEVFYRRQNISQPLPSTEVKVHRFADSVSDKQLPGNLTKHFRHTALGSLAFVDDPYYMLSVIEPGGKNGCTKKFFTTTRSTVSDTVNTRSGGCRVAVNSGYFRVTSGECLGNIVSDGRIIQTSNDEQNANFGVRQDGSIVVGYIPDSEITNTSNPFRQLVSGVIWLVRNGTNFVNESMKLECSSHEDTGKMDTFVNVLSARTAVGHDSQGRVVLAQVDGQTHRRGVNLWQFADLLISHGLVNAINLDGGGSSTFIYNDTLTSYPSDHCWGQPEYRCERQVSTVLCLHDVQCLEPDCNGHGSCDWGGCSCDPPWRGETCQLLDCSQTNCSNHGNCTEGECLCEAGWMGSQCNDSCPGNRYGPGCSSYCWCYGRSYCDHSNGECLCPPGYHGYSCWLECSTNSYGQDCLYNCTYPNCSDHGKCSPVNGSCLCDSGWSGVACNQSVILEQELEKLSSRGTNITSTTIAHPKSTMATTSSTDTLATVCSTDTLTTTSSTILPTSLTPLGGSPVYASHPTSDNPTNPKQCPTPVLSRVTITMVIIVSLVTVLLHAVFCLWTHRTMYRQFMDWVARATRHRTHHGKRRRKRRKRKAHFVPLTADSSSDCSM